ncbi:MAG: hypothetical protein EPN21_18290 [Methylococcaceae bacterium]|nr:MAG: hypothetical protein EPN21_18290 [Methylococcaceae bacterium]
MKSAIRSIPVAVALITSGLLAASSANATTAPAAVAEFTADNAVQTLQPKSTGWLDPAFGDMGWTHKSVWGKVEASKGQTITIKAVSSNADLHPGITVWYRGAEDTAPDSYVADHFYAQNANLFVAGAKDESTGEDLGNIVMKVVKFGYDRDGKGNAKIPGLNGRKDGVSGQLELTFKASRTGTYMFVLGGVNPGADADPAVAIDVETEVTVSGH